MTTKDNERSARKTGAIPTRTSDTYSQGRERQVDWNPPEYQSNEADNNMHARSYRDDRDDRYDRSVSAYPSTRADRDDRNDRGDCSESGRNNEYDSNRRRQSDLNNIRANHSGSIGGPGMSNFQRQFGDQSYRSRERRDDTDYKSNR